MTPPLSRDQYARVWDALDAVAAFPPDQQAAQLDRLLADDAVALREARSLLAAQRSLETPSSPSAARPAVARHEPRDASTLLDRLHRLGRPQAVRPSAAPRVPRPTRSGGHAWSWVAIVMLAGAVAWLWYDRQQTLGEREAIASLAHQRAAAIEAMAVAVSTARDGRAPAIAVIQVLHREAGNDVASLLSAATSYARLARLAAGRGNDDATALALLRNATAIFEYLDQQAGGSPDAQRLLLESHVLSAELQLRAGRREAARTAADAAGDVRRRLRSSGHVDGVPDDLDRRLRSLVAQLGPTAAGPPR